MRRKTLLDTSGWRLNTVKELAIQWLNQAVCFDQGFCLVDSLELRDPLLRLHTNH